MMWGYGQGMGMMWLWSLLLVIGIALLVLLAVWAARGGIQGRPGDGGRGGNYPPAGGSRAREILDERFARGELTEDQYRDHLRVLNEGR
ncbi:SHOCT domain-containing protein [Pseudarthrobacter phenanthrenivorans]|uniref:SHOCT domain-containing protein n=1 Tax=Pseudarthrobacter phenanthrenivorans TaxID=361575 RepID=UPI0011296087|nr:SHOCT domain-containing protein [Pseudarthrobacter phenanthrenivorans]TPV52531.1 SHOCT domain-containing protein [Pseudarthrobacter phenanthrenivorans]